MLAQKLKVEEMDSLLIHNLQALIKRYHLNEAKLARITQLPQPTVHKILTGKTLDPRISTVKVLADYFGLSIDQLYASLGKPGVTYPKLETQSIPIIAWDDCKKGEGFLNGLSPNNWNQWLAVDFVGKKLFALVTKPSMEPLFQIGTLLVIDLKKKLQDGNLVVVYYPNSSEATLRKLSVDGPNQLLIPVNPNLPADKLNSTIKILGVVIQSRFNYNE